MVDNYLEPISGSSTSALGRPPAAKPPSLRPKTCQRSAPRQGNQLTSRVLANKKNTENTGIFAGPVLSQMWILERELVMKLRYWTSSF